MAATIATAASGLFYYVAKSRLKLLTDLGEGSAEEIRSAANASDISLLLLLTSIVATILLSFFLAQKQKDEP